MASVSPLFGQAKSMMVVVPPRMALRVPDAKSSAVVGVAHVEIKVRVRVDESRGRGSMPETSDHLGVFCLGGGDVADLGDLLAVEQDVRAAGAAGRDNKAAPEQFFHIHSAPLSENIHTPLP